MADATDRILEASPGRKRRLALGEAVAGATDGRGGPKRAADRDPPATPTLMPG